MVNMTKTQRVQRGRGAPLPRNARQRWNTAARHRRLFDLHGIELYAVMSYRLAMAVIGLIALMHVTGR